MCANRYICLHDSQAPVLPGPGFTGSLIFLLHPRLLLGLGERDRRRVHLNRPLGRFSLEVAMSMVCALQLPREQYLHLWHCRSLILR